jgi:hypothetical protein
MRKKLFFSLFTVYFFTCFSLNAQIIAWDFDGNVGNEASVNPTTLDPNIEIITPLQRGNPDVIGPPLANSFNSTDFSTSNSVATSFFSGRHLLFQFRTECPNFASVTAINANFRRDANAPTNFNWGYTIGGPIFFFTPTVTFTSTDTNGVTQAQYNLNTVADLQNIPPGTIVTIYLFIRNAANTNGQFALGRLPGNDFSIEGSVTQEAVTTWNGSAWDNGVPSISTPVVINGNYNTGTSGSIAGCSLTINSGANVVVADNTFIEIQNDVTIDGTISVQTRGSFVQNDDTSNFNLIGSGSSSVTKATPVKPDWFFFNYWSSPVQGETIGDVFFDVDGDRRFFFNAANFVDTDGDNIDDDNNDWQFALAGTTMTPGVGYATTSSRLGPYPSSRNAVFTGPFNNGTITTPVAFNAASVNRWNFIGNPYPSAVDFEAFHAANSALIEGVAYFWSQATPPSSSNPGNQNSNFSQSDYATYTVGTGGAAGASGVIPTQFVPSGQGFFVNALAAGNVTFTNAMRPANTTSNAQFFSTAATQGTTSNEDLIDTNTAVTSVILTDDTPEIRDEEIEENRLWLNVTADGGVFNQMLIGYVDGATDADDGAAFDAKRIVNQNFNSLLYSQIADSDTKYAVQGKNSSSINPNEVIPIGFATNLGGISHTISIAQLDGNFLENNTIFLKDNLTDTMHDLSNQDYVFTSETGEFNDRFEIRFSANNTLSTGDVTIDSNAIKIFKTDQGALTFTTSVSSFDTIDIYDITGKLISNVSFNGVRSTSKTLRLNALNNGVYLAKIQLENGVTETKKFINN